MERFVEKERYTVSDLLEIIEILRDPVAGCPWDKVQTHESIRMNFIEETYEVLEAITLQDAHLMCEELGDVMMQVALHCQMEAEKSNFTFDDVCDGVCKKLIYRHPHIFKNPCDVSADAVLNSWDTLKNKEKGRKTLSDDLESVPIGMPALMRAAKMQKRAQSHEIGVQSLEDVLGAVERNAEKISAETEHDTENKNVAVGNLLFAAVQAARAVGVDPEQALEEASARFKKQAICYERLVAESANSEEISAENKASLWSIAAEMQVSEGK